MTNATTETQQRHESEAGFSLVELMVAAAAAVVILGAVLSVTVQHSQQRRGNAELNLAYVAALDTLEQIRTVPFDQLLALDGTGFDVPGVTGATGGLQPVAGDPDGLPGRIGVVRNLTSSGIDLYLVTASVEWSGIQRRRDFVLRQLIVERK